MEAQIDHLVFSSLCSHLLMMGPSPPQCLTQCQVDREHCHRAALDSSVGNPQGALIGLGSGGRNSLWDLAIFTLFYTPWWVVLAPGEAVGAYRIEELPGKRDLDLNPFPFDFLYYKHFPDRLGWSFIEALRK